MVVDWNEKLAQMEFMLREEECKRIDAEERYFILEREMVSQSLEMEEKMAEMERMYMYRLLEEVIFLSPISPTQHPRHSPCTLFLFPFSPFLVRICIDGDTESTNVRPHRRKTRNHGLINGKLENSRRSPVGTKRTINQRLGRREFIVETGVREFKSWIS